MNLKTTALKFTRRPALIALSLTAALLATSEASAGPREPPRGLAIAAGKFPHMNFPARAYGEDAVATLGDKLPAVAAWYGMSTSRFAQTLREDSSAWIDKTGRLFYVDQFPEAAEGATTDPLQEAMFPLSETFTLNSRPDAKVVIYLDFNGHQTSGTAWNASSGIDPIISPAYTRDSDPAFSDTELSYVQQMWRQVAEDYALFDVNVTTQDPGLAAIARSGSSDEYYGARVVVTRDNFDNCGCGGFAYLTSFNDTSDYYKTAFVFNTSLVAAGEAISHEAGHSLGLNHDGITGGTAYYRGHGSGDTGWAPIMGTGYYQNLVQWSKGEYDSANNVEDDISRMQNYGVRLVVDDHADSDNAATALTSTPNGSSVVLSGSGMVRSSQDVDMFSFLSGGGSYSIDVNPAPFSPNLDVSIELFDGDGNLVASANPADSLTATLSGNLPAGEYFLRVDGVGKGDPLATGYSDYGSLGRYTVAGIVSDPGSLVAPVAWASAPDYSANYAPLYVGFDGSGSTDSDGNIVSWDWDFGDGNSASGALVNHSFDAPGVYTVTLTVQDEDGLTANDSLAVEVLNQAPVAVASSDVSSGQGPLTVNFSSDYSEDPDSSGSIAAYAWDFGDGSSSSQANPSHTYTGSGQFNATLTVADNLGATGSTTVTLDVEASPLIDQYATSEQFGAGTVSGTYTATHNADGSEQFITERQSGGKRNSRYSYLEHTWLFNIQQGNAVTLYLTARQDASSDGDQMTFSYSVNGSSYTPLPFSLGTSSATYAVELPTVGGDVRIRVNDSNHDRGNLALDTVYVDQIYIRSDSQGVGAGTPPQGASNAAAVALAAGQIDLSWADNSTDEQGFRIERSMDAATWSVATNVASNQTNYRDSGLSSNTTYYYRVLAYNGAGQAPASDVVYETTVAASSINLDVSAYKRRGIKHATLTWTGLANANVYRDGSLVAADVRTNYDDNIGKKGSSSYTYQVCSGDLSSTCSNEATVVF